MLPTLESVLQDQGRRDAPLNPLRWPEPGEIWRIGYDLYLFLDPNGLDGEYTGEGKHLPCRHVISGQSFKDYAYKDSLVDFLSYWILTESLLRPICGSCEGEGNEDDYLCENCRQTVDT